MTAWERSISVVIFLNWVDMHISVTGCAVSVVLWSHIVIFPRKIWAVITYTYATVGPCSLLVCLSQISFTSKFMK